MNIILIGMPGAGKSTVGVILSKIMNLNFTDTDILIQQAFGMKLAELIESRGVSGFLDAESQTILNVGFRDTVVATGGSVVYRKETMEHLKADGKVVYIDVSLSEIKRRVQNMTARGVAALNAETIEELYYYFKDEPRVVKLGDCGCEELKGYIGRCRFFIGARTHATIAAYSSLVPTYF